MSSTKKTSSTQTTTPNAPSWLSPQTQTLATNTVGLGNANPQSYVAGADPLQTQAAAGAAGLTQNAGAYSTANNVLTGLATGGGYTPATIHPNSILPNLASYMSPYTNDVVNASLADYDYGAGQSLGQAKLALASDDTFGGSGGKFELGNTLAGLARGRGTLSSGLRDQAFQTGAGLAGQDADRRQSAQEFNAGAFNQARQFNANTAGTAAQNLVAANQAQSADQRANIGAQSDIGSILQQIAQAQAGAPLNVQGTINSAYGSLMPATGLLTGQTTTGTTKTKSGGLGGALGSLGSLAMGLGAIGFAPFTGGASLAGLAGLGGAGAAGLTGAGDLAAFA